MGGVKICGLSLRISDARVGGAVSSVGTLDMIVRS